MEIKVQRENLLKALNINSGMASIPALATVVKLSALDRQLRMVTRDHHSITEIKVPGIVEGSGVIMLSQNLLHDLEGKVKIGTSMQGLYTF